MNTHSMCRSSQVQNQRQTVFHDARRGFFRRVHGVLYWPLGAFLWG